MTQENPHPGIPGETAPNRVDNGRLQLTSALVSAGVCAGAGWFVGKMGDAHHRTLAQVSLALIGAAFGFSMSLYALSGHDKRPYEDGLRANMLRSPVQPPATTIAAPTAQRDGVVEEKELARA